MPWILFIAAIAAVALLSGVVPDVGYRLTFVSWKIVAAANALVIALTLGLVLWIEWRAQKLTGYLVPFGRRILIPVPAFLAFATVIKVIVKPFGGYGTDGAIVIYQNATLIFAGLLPFLLIEETGTPVRFILEVWFGYVLWGAAMFVLLDALL